MKNFFKLLNILPTKDYEQIKLSFKTSILQLNATSTSNYNECLKDIVEAWSNLKIEEIRNQHFDHYAHDNANSISELEDCEPRKIFVYIPLQVSSMACSPQHLNSQTFTQMIADEMAPGRPVNYHLIVSRLNKACRMEAPVWVALDPNEACFVSKQSSLNNLLGVYRVGTWVNATDIVCYNNLEIPLFALKQNTVVYAEAIVDIVLSLDMRASFLSDALHRKPLMDQVRNMQLFENFLNDTVFWKKNTTGFSHFPRGVMQMQQLLAQTAYLTPLLPLKQLKQIAKNHLSKFFFAIVQNSETEKFYHCICEATNANRLHEWIANHRPGMQLRIAPAPWDQVAP